MSWYIDYTTGEPYAGDRKSHRDPAILDRPSPDHIWTGEAWTLPADLYQSLRRAEYPPLGDQVDAIFKGMVALRDAGQTLPADTLAWLYSIKAVKARYPKPAATQ